VHGCGTKQYKEKTRGDETLSPTQRQRDKIARSGKDGLDENWKGGRKLAGRGKSGKKSSYKAISRRVCGFTILRDLLGGKAPSLQPYEKGEGSIDHGEQFLRSLVKRETSKGEDEKSERTEIAVKNGKGWRTETVHIYRLKKKAQPPSCPEPLKTSRTKEGGSAKLGKEGRRSRSVQEGNAQGRITAKTEGSSTK